MKFTEDVEVARNEVERVEAGFLRERGWKHTSEIACTWLWLKEIDGRVVAVNASTARARGGSRG